MQPLGLTIFHLTFRQNSIKHSQYLKDVIQYKFDNSLINDSIKHFQYLNNDVIFHVFKRTSLDL